MTKLREILSQKTDDELMPYLTNISRFTEEAVLTALALLKERNFPLPDDIDETIEHQLLEKKEREKEKPYKNVWKTNIVKDVEAEEFYSQNAIYCFSILFSTLFGSVMLAYNLNKIGKPFGWAVLFGLVYTGLTIFILGDIEANMMSSFIANSLGGVILYQLFWNKWIGGETKYRAKPIWVPLIIGIVISILLIIAAFSIVN